MMAARWQDGALVTAAVADLELLGRGPGLADKERDHDAADDILCAVLTDVGYPEVAEAFENARERGLGSGMPDPALAVQLEQIRALPEVER